MKEKKAIPHDPFRNHSVRKTKFELFTIENRFFVQTIQSQSAPGFYAKTIKSRQGFRLLVTTPLRTSHRYQRLRWPTNRISIVPNDKSGISKATSPAESVRVVRTERRVSQINTDIWTQRISTLTIIYSHSQSAMSNLESLRQRPSQISNPYLVPPTSREMSSEQAAGQ